MDALAVLALTVFVVPSFGAVLLGLTLVCERWLATDGANPDDGDLAVMHGLQEMDLALDADLLAHPELVRLSS